MRYTCFTLLVSLALLSIGPSHAETIFAPSGAVLEVAKCKGSSADCMRQAGRVCGGSYQVIDSESHAGGALADLMPGPVTWYSMIFQCGPSDGKMPNFEARGPEYRPPSMTSCTLVGQSVLCWGS